LDTISEVRLSEVRKVFGRHPALSGVTCTLARGQVALLMGPNGAGKSTLLTILSTLSRPTSGDVLYGERDHRHAEQQLRGRIGLVAHAPMLYRPMTSRENLRFFARLHGLRDAPAAVDRWLERVGMTHAADRPVQLLSRGMVQRVALARALLPEPELLLLDEPFTGLDREATSLLRRELEAARDAGRIVALVSHDVDAIGGLCDHLLVLARGRVAADVSEGRLGARQLIERYQDAIGGAARLGTPAPRDGVVPVAREPVDATASEAPSDSPASPSEVPAEATSVPSRSSDDRSAGQQGARDPATAPGSSLGHALHIAAKDLRVEWRSREVLYTMCFFAVLVVVIFSFAFARQGQPMHEVAGGILWTVVAFAGTLGLGRVFDREREGDTHRALLLAPVSRGAVYLGKLLAVFAFIGLTEAIVVPLLVVLFQLQVASVPVLVALLLLGTLGFAAVGSLFAATLLEARSRDVLLGIFLFPVVTPVIVAGAKGTAALMAGPAEAASALVWLKLLFAFDLLFVTLSLWVFGPLTRGE
jgi:heme exporter protein CcmB